MVPNIWENRRRLWQMYIYIILFIYKKNSQFELTYQLILSLFSFAIPWRATEITCQDAGHLFDTIANSAIQSIHKVIKRRLKSNKYFQFTGKNSLSLDNKFIAALF